MLITETVTINDRQFTKNYSDSGFYIERDGAKYSEAYDPIEFKDERIYTETDEKIDIEPTPEPVDTDTVQKAEAWDELTGGSANE